MSYRIEIKEGNVVEVFEDQATVPFLRQPNWPNRSPWADANEARNWAELFVAAIVDADAPYAPVGPGLAGEPKPTPEQIAEFRQQREQHLGR